ncbi:DUF2946 domain-containing protein [Rugamonas apoptosis]|uniref:DUF2946 domain-containing protein n=1 Tax=Rugamonas apoptosis TaxID=2758570 RepID=A0A7W2F8Z0_9BURK|nr:DUF2946 domain-containing protein [Rugamonas apoptosis]MBA5687306.1 DUF2946 domain-containing protein [Rugamonas apoptosis]
MNHMAKRQTLRIWIAMLAILFSALAPSISHALAAANGAIDKMEVCTSNGYKLVKVPDSDNSKAPASAKNSMEHCAFCTTHGGSYALTGSPSVPLALGAGRDIYPPLFYTAPHSLHAWSAAHPRAPPFLA